MLLLKATLVAVELFCNSNEEFKEKMIDYELSSSWIKAFERSPYLFFIIFLLILGRNFFVGDEIDASFYRNMFLAGFFSPLII